MSEYLDRPIRTREEYLIEKMKALTMTAADWHEWLNMPTEQKAPIRSVRDDIPDYDGPIGDSFFFFPSSFND